MGKNDWQKLYESLTLRTEALERENKALRLQIMMLETQGRTWEVDKISQQDIIQNEITKVNTKCQEQGEEIVRLRALLKEKSDVC